MRPPAKVFCLIKRLLRRLKASIIPSTPAVADCLDAASQSLIGTIPATPDGKVGHDHAVDIFFDLVAHLGPAVFCDIGANQGEAGRRAKETLPTAQVFGFEANPAIHARYSDLNVAAGVNWVNAAVADAAGTLTLHVPKFLSRELRGGSFTYRRVTEAENTGKASLLKRDEAAEYASVSVPAVTLDHYLSKEAPQGRVALWIDVEGAASLVLRGAMQTLSRTDILIIEVEGFGFWQDQTLAASVLRTLEDEGFVPVLRDREYQDAQFNVICLRATPSHSEQRALIRERLDGLRSDKAPASPDGMPTPATTPVLVPCFNNPSYSDAMLQQLLARGFRDITFIDNASDSAEMHAWLDTVAQSGAKVERLNENLGPRKSIFANNRLARLPRWFCVTDPDIQFNPALPPDFLATLADTMLRHRFGKAGFALNIARPTALRQEKFTIGEKDYHIWEWEKQFWANRVEFTTGGDPVYRADIDTTFALHDLQRFNEKKFMTALRVGGRMTAEHLPWYPAVQMTESELSHYRASQKFSYYHR